MLRRITIDFEKWNEIFERYPNSIEYVDDLNSCFLGYKDKRIIKVDKATSTAIIQQFRVPGLKYKESEGWKQVICCLDNSLDKDEVRVLPWARDARSAVNKCLKKYYKPKEIAALLKSHSSRVQQSPLHKLLLNRCCDGHVHKFKDCVYYDINGAHRDALIEIFPLAEKELLELDKGIINVYVGNLCREFHRPTYNWIVNRTRDKLTKIIEDAGGIILYMNTDGVILWHPDKQLPTSTKIGDIKSELLDGVVYAYYCPRDNKTTSYTLYQYVHPTKGIQKKGNARLTLRKDMDLSQGLVVKCKIVRDDKNKEKIENLRIERVPVDEEI